MEDLTSGLRSIIVTRLPTVPHVLSVQYGDSLSLGYAQRRKRATGLSKLKPILWATALPDNNSPIILVRLTRPIQ